MENADLCVYTSNSKKDIEVIQTLKSLFQTALSADKVNLSDIAKTLKTDSIADITHMLEDAEDKKAQQAAEQYKSQQEIEAQRLESEERRYQDELSEKQNDNGLLDPLEIAEHALATQKLSSEEFHKKLVEDNKNKQHKDKVSLEKEKINSKEKIEKLKIKQTEIQNKNQIDLANKKAKLDKEMMEKKIAIEKIKARKKPSGK